MIRVAILCGGLGTRLGPLAGNLPKPMIDVGGRPYLERVIESFSSRGLRELVLLTGHRAEVIEQHFADGARFGVSISYSRESEPIGTGGALRDARALLGPRFIVTYGDVLRYFDYDHFVARHASHCLAVYPRIHSGNADVRAGRVVRFDKHAPELPFVDAGFSLIGAPALDVLPATGPCSFEEIVFPELIRRGEMEGEIIDHEFFDIGTPDELARTRAALEEQ